MVVKKYKVVKQQYEQMMQKPLHFQPSVCGFNALHAVFQLFKVRQEEITGIHDVKLVFFIGNYIENFFFSIVNI